MTERPLAIVVLAAGKGTRMKSARPKVLHKVAGRSLLGHVLAAAESLHPTRIVAVVGPGMDDVADEAAPHPTAIQEGQLGTGDAVRAALPTVADLCTEKAGADLMIVFGDTPFLTAETLSAMRAQRSGPDAPSLVALGFEPEDPGAYGRLLLDENGAVLRNVEYKDALKSDDPEIRRALEVTLCNGGALLGDAAVLSRLIGALDNDNAQGEYYLTDVFAMARAEGHLARVQLAEEWEVMGINARGELARAEALYQDRRRAAAMAEGVTLIDPASVFFSHDTAIGRDCLIEPQVFFGPGVTLDEGVTVRAFSHLEGCRLASGATVGPFARLRPGAVVGKKARVGNFVEVKNARLHEGAKANHLTYLGDAEIGAGANVGAGTITCNYDGFAKYKTEIGPKAFIGSNSALVAPVTVAEGAVVGAGSVITHDVPADGLAIARGRQVVIDQGGAHLRERYKDGKDSSTAERQNAPRRVAGQQSKE